MTPPYIAVVGAGVSSGHDEVAERVGRELAKRGAYLVCGGLGGVMEAACRGARAAGGTAIAILPSSDRGDANAYVDVAIATGMGEMRNALIVRSVDVVIAVAGEFGTLSEIAFALKIGKPVVGIDTWDLGDPIVRASSAEEAVAKALELARRR